MIKGQNFKRVCLSRPKTQRARALSFRPLRQSSGLREKFFTCLARCLFWALNLVLSGLFRFSSFGFRILIRYWLKRNKRLENLRRLHCECTRCRCRRNPREDPCYRTKAISGISIRAGIDSQTDGRRRQETRRGLEV